MISLIDLLETNNYELTIEEIEKNKEGIGVKDEYNNTVLMYYLINNENPSIEIIKMLKDEINILADQNITMLMWYCGNNNIEKLNTEIIEYFFNLIGKQDIEGNTALIYYLKYNNNPKLDDIKLLKNEINLFNKNNITPLMYYCMNENIESLNLNIIYMFYNLIGIKDIKENNSLMYYLENNINPKLEIVRLLKKEIDRKNNIYLKNKTIISYCKNLSIENLNLEIIKYILQKIDKKNEFYNDRTILIIESFADNIKN